MCETSPGFCQAESLTETRPGLAESWRRLAHAKNRLKAPKEEVLACYDKAIEVQPYQLDAYYSKMRVLSEAYRYDEALAVMNDPRWGGTPPQALRFAHAQILFQQSRQDEAIAAMQALTDEDPSHAGYWRQLADWFQSTGRHEEYLDVCANIIRTDPHDAMSYGYRISGLMELNRHAEIEPDCRAAIALNPEYEYAGRNLLVQLVAEKRYDEATELLSYLAPHWLPANVLYCRHLIFRARNSYAEMLANFEQLIALPTSSYWMIEEAGGAFFEMNRPKDSWKALQTAMKKSICAPAAYYWGVCAAHQLKHREAIKRLNTPVQDTLIEHAAREGYIEQLGNMEAQQALKNAIGHLKSKLRRDTELWAATTKALQHCNLLAETNHWIDGYKLREGVTPEALADALLCNWRAERYEETSELLDDALALPADQTHDLLLLMKAFLLFRRGSHTDAQALLNEVHPPALNEFYEPVCELLQIGLSLQTPAEPENQADIVRFKQICEAHIKQFGPTTILTNLGTDILARLPKSVPIKTIKPILQILKTSGKKAKKAATATRESNTGFGWGIAIVIYLIIKALIAAGS